jgi:hypothetical protein
MSPLERALGRRDAALARGDTARADSIQIEIDVLAAALRRQIERGNRQRLSIQAVAQRIGVTRQRIYNLIDSGVVRTFSKTGSGYTISEPDAQLLVDAAVRVQVAGGKERIVFDFI